MLKTIIQPEIAIYRAENVIDKLLTTIFAVKSAVIMLLEAIISALNAIIDMPNAIIGLAKCDC